MACAGGLRQNSAIAANFSDGFRWSATATDGTGLTPGDGTTLLWSIVPDGVEVEGAPSNLVSFLDARYGAGSGGGDLTQRPWFSILSDGLDAFASKTGLTFTYTADDAAAWGGVPSSGTRGDIRLAGYDLPTPGELGRAALPIFGGDLLLDTANGSLGNPNTLGSLFQHEMGHALGLGHVSVEGASVLMNIGNLPQNGPQFDDLFALTRLYGDRFEAGPGNDTWSTATNLGSVSPSTPLAVGSDVAGLGVLVEQTDYVSVNNHTDVDFYRFQTTGPANLVVHLSPQGPTYNFTNVPAGAEDPQTLVASSQSNLSLTVYAGDGITPLGQLDRTALGQAESLASFNLPVGGEYFLGVSGAENANQFYRLDIATEAIASTPTPLVFYDGFGSQSNELGASLSTVGRQSTGYLTSPYDDTLSTSNTLLSVNNAKLALVATDAGGAPEAAVVAPVRNFGAEIAGERWLLSLDVLVESNAANAGEFSLVLSDAWPLDQPGGNGAPSNDAALTLQLNAVGDYFVAEYGGNAAGESNVSGTALDSDYQVQILVDESDGMPRITVGIDGVTVMDSQAVPLADLQRYFSFRAATLGAAATNDFVSAEIDRVSIVNLTDLLAGDYNYDGQVTLADYVVWRDNLGMHVLPGTAADGDGDGVVGNSDYSFWLDQFSPATGATSLQAVPEPASLVLMLLGGLLPLRRKVKPCI